MAMDFFGSQDQARRQTGLLVGLFIGAVVGIVASVYGLVVWALNTFVAPDGFWQPKIFFLVTIATLLVVGFGSAFKIMQLKGGGSAVAESLGGRLLMHESANAQEKQLLNVVEEMAIASGVPVPPVYLMDEENQVNAFAAGYTLDDAVIGVTRGCCDLLNRAELQGVIAHEYSHILNGDMRLNIRMIGILSGILTIGAIGYGMLRLLFYSGAVRHRSSRSKKNDNGQILLALGAIAVGLIVIGFIGTFFGKLIKAATSRQREFLADASAVQFTRNPEGIAGALKKIGSAGAHVHHANAAEASHLFFGQALSSGLDGMLATHPPLNDRIKRLDPTWDGQLPGFESMPNDASPISGFAGGQTASAKLEQGALADSVDHVGQLDEAHIHQAGNLIQHLPEALREEARTPYGARGVLYLLLIDPDPDIASQQWARLETYGHPEVAQWAQAMMPTVAALNRTQRLVLLDLAAPSLRALCPSHRQSFLANLKALARADAKIELFEWVLLRIAHHHLGIERQRQGAKISRQDAVHLLLSTLAYAGASGPEQAASAFETGARSVQLNRTILDHAACNLNALGDALDALAGASGRVKKTLLQACAACVEADHQVTIHEAELLRAIAADLGCPMPPPLPNQ